MPGSVPVFFITHPLMVTLEDLLPVAIMALLKILLVVQFSINKLEELFIFIAPTPALIKSQS